MNDQFLKEVKEHLIKYLERSEDILQFQAWFVPKAWGTINDPDIGPFVADIELRLAEYTSGHLPEPELREELRALLEGRLTQTKIEFKVVGEPQGYVVELDTRPDQRPQELAILIG